MPTVSCNSESAVCLSDLTKNIWATSDGSEVVGKGDLTSPGGIITAGWPYLFAIAGLILFAMLTWGALEIQFGAADTKSAESGKKRITNAVIGFVLLFSVFWLGQIVQQIFGLNFGVGQEIPTQVEAPAPVQPPPAVEPLQDFVLSAADFGNQLRLCASSAQNLSSYSTQSIARLYANGETLRERNLTLQSGTSSRCVTVQSTSAAQQLVIDRLYSAEPSLRSAGISWRTEVLVDENSGRTYYTLVPSSSISSLTPEVQQQLWNAVVAVNTSGLSETVRIDIDSAARTYSIHYRVDGVSNPGN
jgi:hypothetical protein